MAALSAAAVIPSFSSSTICLTRSRGLPPSEMSGQRWGSQTNGDGRVHLRRAVNFVKVGTRPVRPQVQMMGNKNDGKGLFAPIVVVARNILGAKKFNQLRGKGIALHSQVITEFCKSIGADAKQRQGLIRLAKKNGEKLGFLA